MPKIMGNEPVPRRVYLFEIFITLMEAIILSRLGVFGIDFLTLDGVYAFLIFGGALAASNVICLVSINVAYESEDKNVLLYAISGSLISMLFIMFTFPFIDPSIGYITYFVDVLTVFLTYWVFLIVTPVLAGITLYWVW